MTKLKDLKFIFFLVLNMPLRIVLFFRKISMRNNMVGFRNFIPSVKFVLSSNKPFIWVSMIGLSMSLGRFPVSNSTWEI